MMSFDNISAIPSLIGGGFLVGAFLGYFIRKVIKIILFALGVIFTKSYVTMVSVSATS